MNWNYANTITTEMASECYTTESLVDLFMRLEREGYSALGLGLIIDLVRGQAERTD